jgi:hypothetical protein
MEWTEIISLIDSELIIVVVACWLIGGILKQTPKVPDWSIVYLLLVTAIVFSVWLTGFGPGALLQGILCAAVASYGYDFFKQTLKGLKKDE